MCNIIQEIELIELSEGVKEIIENEKNIFQQRVDFLIGLHKEDEESLKREINIITNIYQKRVKSILNLFIYHERT